MGGGLSGLSCAYHLKKPSLVIEKDKEIGGTAKSVLLDGYTFDFTGHLLHLHHAYTKRLIQQLLKGNLVRRQRKAWIYSHKTYSRYPFQINTFGLPKNVIQDCVKGFLKAEHVWKDKRKRHTKLPFKTWCQRTFGEGIYKHFMKPYNEKLWRISLDQMTAEWCGQFVPQPNKKDVLAGSQKPLRKKFGYNTTFLYPRRGGIQSLAIALSKGLHVQTDTSLKKLDWKDQRVFLSNGKVIPFTDFVSCIPLVELLKKMAPLPKDIEDLLKGLRWISVLNINIGVRRPNISDKSWIYFPEDDFTFYRVGFPMNFTPAAVPKGCSSMYVEVSNRPNEEPDFNSTFRRVRDDLIKCKILQENDSIQVVNYIPIRYAYVIYDSHRQYALPIIFSFLKKHNIHSIGRYGAWKYSFMEEAILDGKRTAEEIDSQ